ncbi:MAG: YfbU family protein [Candidatus Omnitrophota bacterium]
MQLSKIERLILANQYEILATSNSKDKDKERSYLEKKEIIEKGCLCEYEKLFESIQENEMTEEKYQEVREILTMFNDIQWSYENLSDKRGIDEKEIIFKGFDLNLETGQYRYAEVFLNKSGTSNKFLPKRSRELNSHSPMLKKYRKMYSVWNAISNRIPKGLNEEQIKSIF